MIRLAVIGRGRWGSRIAATLAEIGGTELIAESRDIKKILAAEPAGVLIATPSPTHAAIALPFIEAGIPTFIEKPLTTDVRDAEQLQNAALRSGAPLFVGHVHLYNPAFQAVQKLVSQLGKVRAVICEGMNQSPRADSSVLWDWLPHFLAMTRAIGLSEPTDVRTCVTSQKTQIEVATCRFQCGDVELAIHASWLAAERRTRMTIAGETGRLVFDDLAQEKATLVRGDSTAPLEYSPERPLARELAAFLQTIRSGRQDERQLAAEVAIVRQITAAQASAQAGGERVMIGEG